MPKLIRHKITSKCRYVGDQFCSCGSGNIRYPLTSNGEFLSWACGQCAPRKIKKLELEYSNTTNLEY